MFLFNHIVYELKQLKRYKKLGSSGQAIIQLGIPYKSIASSDFKIEKLFQDLR